MTIWSSALHSWHTGLCVEGVPLRGTSILRLRRAPFGFIGRRPSGQARRLFGWSQTRESLCRTPVSKGLLVSYAIRYFHFSACSLRRIRARQRSLDFASVDERALHSCHTAAARGYSYGMQYRGHRSFQNSQRLYSMMRRTKTLNPST